VDGSRRQAAQSDAFQQPEFSEDHLIDDRSVWRIQVPPAAQIEDAAEKAAIGSLYAHQLNAACARYDFGMRLSHVPILRSKRPNCSVLAFDFS
jgi:hypothetical protein